MNKKVHLRKVAYAFTIIETIITVLLACAFIFLGMLYTSQFKSLDHKLLPASLFTKIDDAVKACGWKNVANTYILFYTIGGVLLVIALFLYTPMACLMKSNLHTTEKHIALGIFTFLFLGIITGSILLAGECKDPYKENLNHSSSNNTPSTTSLLTKSPAKSSTKKVPAKTTKVAAKTTKVAPKTTKVSPTKKTVTKKAPTKKH
ncbi:MAG: hypothetical protein Ta2E_05510 [Mycoplasmoidaceae bacterium]|nr:MAG: hypothetical protein Ta2E_05510 [Mycoplasmoidaceae bacterium]